MNNLPMILGDKWINVDKPISQNDLKDKVVLVDFWTYSCVNCLRTLPYLKDWWKKYKKEGLVIIGIHAPEFGFEKDFDNVKTAIDKLDITWPIVLDNNLKNWATFDNHYWPAKYITNRKGEIVYTHFGEGEYEETEKVIRSLLGLEGTPLRTTKGKMGNVCFVATPETYCGYERGKITNEGGYKNNEAFNYSAPKDIPTDSIALSGNFIANKEYVETEEIGAKILLRFRGTEVNLVISSISKKARIKILFDDEAPSNEIFGEDVKSGQVNISEPRMYRLIKSKAHLEGLLSVVVIEGSIRAHAFTFSGCVE